MFKKLFFICTVVFLVVLFTLPQFAFADEGNTDEYVGEINDQYIIGDTQDSITDDSHNENNHNGDGDTEVFCIDVTESINDVSGSDGYINTGLKIGDTGTLDPSNPVNSGISAQEADNIQVLAENATGATAEEDQVAVWKNSDSGASDSTTGYSSLSTQEKADVNLILSAVNSLTDSSSANDIHNSDGDAVNGESINDITVTLDSKPLVDEATNDINTFTATATMEDPLVPTITDKNKTVYWYILAGSYNVSFDSTKLVTEKSSIMQDQSGSIADVTSTISTYADNKGVSTVPYYYYYWGGSYTAETMAASMFAWVDIDSDNKLDVIDKASPGSANTDGDVIGTLQSAYNVVPSANNPAGFPNPVDTSASVDQHKLDGGIVIDQAKNDKHWCYWHNKWEYDNDNDVQRFVTVAYDEPYNVASKSYSSFGEIKITKTDGDAPQGQNIMSGVSFTATPVDASGNPTAASPVTVQTNASGIALFGSLAWGYYKIEEITPQGYVPNTARVVYVGPDRNGVVSADLKWEISIANDRKDGEIIITKTDKDNADAIMPGVVFTLYKDGNPVLDKDGKPVTATTNASGIATFSALVWGTYSVMETTPAGYVPVGTIAVEAINAANLTGNVTVSNSRIPGEIIITKTDKDNAGAIMPGVVFTLYKDGSPVLKDGVAVTATTNASGVATFSGLVWGTYTIMETTPAGYVAKVGNITVEAINAAKTTVNVDVQNTRLTGDVTITKTSLATGSPISEVVFLLTNVATGEERTITTDAGGIGFIEGLVWGEYTLEEVSASGYIIDTTVHSFTVGPNNKFNLTWDFVNTPTPPPTPTPPAGIVTVAALIEETPPEAIEVESIVQAAGVQVLAFTGLAPIIPISGGAIVLGGIALLIATLKRRVAVK